MTTHPALAYLVAQQMLGDLRDEAANHRQSRRGDLKHRGRVGRQTRRKH